MGVDPLKIKGIHKRNIFCICMFLEEHRKNRVGCHRCCQHIFLDLVIRISGTSNHIYVIYSEQKEKRPQSQQHYDCHGSGCKHFSFFCQSSLSDFFFHFSTCSLILITAPNCPNS